MTRWEQMPLLSIVVPVYGTEQYFERCINSLLEQSYKNLEIIIVNDGSPGNITDLVAPYLVDTRVVFIDNKENRGLLRARVCGAREAHGNYIAFVDSDDYVSSDFYRVLIKNAIENGSDITIGKTVWEEGGERYIYNYHETCFNFEKLNGEDVREAFFMQETQCYSWHTIWNKVYRKSLWDKCMSEYESVDQHIIMTEDIYFSSIMFFNAQSVTRVNSEAYFYCSNENASTNAKDIKLNRFEKNIHDIDYVFGKVNGYLIENKADTRIVEAFKRGKSHYGRMWKNLAETVFSDEDKEKAIQMVANFCDDYGKQKVQHDYFFESIRTPWNGGLEYIKNRIKDAKDYISFDVFDTLISRPFYNPTDMFCLMNEEFSSQIGSFISFEKIRKEGEELARIYFGNTYGYEDITLDEIYDYISRQYQIDENIAIHMKNYERDLELRFCKPRYAGKELFEYAKAIGKKIILVSDMYLDAELIRKILVNNGIYGYQKLYLSCEYRKLKYNGELFKVALADLKIEANQVLHVGDTWRSDIEGSERIGISNVFFPKAREVFENKIQGCATNHCSDIGMLVTGDNHNKKKVLENIGYRSMLALVVNKYFDNPYRTFNPNSDFNVDPFLVGYYPVGMHMLGVSKWLHAIMQDSGYESLIFLARDGFLPMKAYEEYIRQQDFYQNHYEIKYLQASRKAIMPILLREKINFYQIPIEYRAHSPKSLLKVLYFACNECVNDIENVERILTNAELDPDKPFTTVEEFHDFIQVFFKSFYDEAKHKDEIEKVEEYYSQISGKSLAFDMGYSGRIQSAICEAAKKPIDVAFIHEDYQTSVLAKRHYGFKIHKFYDFVPEISGLMREHIFSDVSGSCVGFGKSTDNVEAVFEECNHIYPDQYVIKTIQSGALSFIHDFVSTFDGFMKCMDYSQEDVSMPFEGFLRFPNAQDMHIFSSSFFEDVVFGGRAEINIEAFAMDNLARLGWPRKEVTIQPEIENTRNPDEIRITNLIHGSSQLKRGIIWIILDWAFFSEKLKINIKRLFNRERN